MESTIETLRFRLRAHRGKWPNLSRISRVPISTLRKIGGGFVKSPGIGTVDKLVRGLDKLEKLAPPKQ